MDCTSDSGKMEFSLSFVSVAEGIFTIFHFWILISVTHIYSIKSVIIKNAVLDLRYIVKILTHNVISE